MNGSSALTKRAPRQLPRSFCEDTVRIAVCDPGSGLSPDVESASALISGFPASRTLGDQCLLFKPPDLYFCCSNLKRLRQELVLGVGCCCHKSLKTQRRRWNWVVGRAWRNLKHKLEKVDIAEHGPLRAILVGTRKETRESLSS